MSWVPPDNMDPECVELCKAMNALPGIKTYESCCGHGEYPFWVWFDVTDFEARGLLTLSRLLCRNYFSEFAENWQVVMDHRDTGPQLCFRLEGRKVVGALVSQIQANRLAEVIMMHVKDQLDYYNILLDGREWTPHGVPPDGWMEEP